MAKASDQHLTPAMRQYQRFKQQYPQCVLFFRMGDFYEMFYDDAKLAHKVLGVTLTQRTQGVPMAGVPYHAVEGYLRRMIQAGYRVAVCEQVEGSRDQGAEGPRGQGAEGGGNPITPSSSGGSGGVMERVVSRVVTPGTLTDESLLEEGRENPLAAVVFHAPGGSSKSEARNPKLETAVSIAWAELSTGSFFVATLNEDELADELARIGPRELLYCETADGRPPKRISQLGEALGCALTARPAWQFRLGQAVETLKRQYRVAHLAGFGFDDTDPDPALAAAGVVVQYLLETQCAPGSSEINAEDAKKAEDAKEQDKETRRQREGETRLAGAAEEVQSSKFKIQSADISHQPSAIRHSPLAHLQPPRRFARHQHLVIDQTSLRSLEIERTLRTGSTEGSVLGTLQNCVTAMGKRLLRHWLCYPLRERDAIEHRQRVVRAMVNDSRFLDELREALDDVQDIQRITARLAVNRATPRDLVALGRSAHQVRQLEQLLAQRPTVAHFHQPVAELVEPLESLAQRIEAGCIDEPPAHLREGGLIRDGYDAQLDEYRSLQRDSNVWLAGYQKELIDATGINSLKVGFNKVFGYYIEVTAIHRARLDDPALAELFQNWTRKQTLKNAERFITPQLKEYEQKVLSAESRAIAREQALFAELCEDAQQQMAKLHAFAELVAALDVLGGFARRAVRHRYVQPTIVDEPTLLIRGGRHPVLDELLGDQFVPNDVELGKVTSDELRVASSSEPTDLENSQLETRNSQLSLALITGPNMAGKSTYIRQAALITLLAHTGSFVPADAATIGLCDRIFTRIGASDELHTGQSTFMVEMTETANICHHATDRSLVILDEIGRGTSTLDGLSLAWALAEHLAEKGPRCLFATHYHELTTLADRYRNVTNLNVTVREWQEEIVFLHRIAPGRADRSYGIHVAKIAGLPKPVIDRANVLLGELAVNHNHSKSEISDLKSQRDGSARATPDSQPELDAMPLFGEVQSSKFKIQSADISHQPSAIRHPQAPSPPHLVTHPPPHPALEALRQLDLNQLTPLQAFDHLRALHEQAGDDGVTG